MTLYDDAYTEYANRNSSLTYTYNAIVYSPYDFGGASYSALLDSCVSENGSGIRSIFLPNTTQTVSMTNTAIISMLRGAYNIVQENWDAYLAILNQITAGTITTTGQISPAWTAYLSTYSTNRVIEPTNEALAASISSMPSQVQSNWTQASSGAVDFIKNKPAARSQSSASRSLNSGFQVSTTRDSLVNYSVDVSTSATLIGGQTGTVFLEIASDSGFTTNLQELARFVNGNAVSLAIAITITQNVTGTLSGYVPANYYCRLRTANTVGSPSFAFRSGQEILL